MNIIIAVIVLGILIFVHELGHFLVAKYFNVYVEKFSIGFGPRLYSRQYGETEYTISAVPLGGYVKMYGEGVENNKQNMEENSISENQVEPSKIGRSFLDKTPWQKAAIVLAGPLFNVLFAILIFWGLYMTGINSYAPVLTNIEAGSPAYNAGLKDGDKVTAVDGKEIKSWTEFSEIISESSGKTLQLTLADNRQVEVAVGSKEVDDIFGDKKHVGFIGAGLLVDAVVGEVVPDMPAEKAGIKAGDKIISINNTPVLSWSMSAEYIRNNPDKELSISIDRKGEIINLTVTPKASETGSGENKKEIGLIGVSPYQGDVVVRYNPLDAMILGLEKSYDLTKLIYAGLAKLVTQDIPADSLGGPILIMQTAAQSAESGLSTLLIFMAMISINLAVFNLLPIPVLDGGQLVIITAEGVMGRPLGEKVMGAFQMAGLCFIISLMIFAFYNDIMRFFKS